MRNVAIFVSSTFADMQSERDIIREKIAPEVEDRLRSYGLNAEFIDLRWGIDTKGASEEEASAKIMRSCFDEIKRTEPYFVVLLGERYGWVPPYDEIYPALEVEGLENAPEFKDKSVTEIEIAFAREYYSRKDKCIFYFRSPVDYGEDVAAREAQVSSGKEAEKLCALKETIAEKYPRQVRHYDASWDVSRQEIVGLEKFEGALLEDILGTIIDECDVGNSDLDEIGESLNIQRSFVEREAENFSGRNIALDVLRNFVESDNKALLLLGNSGCGKTAILAKFAKEEQLKGIRVVSFFAGISRYASSAEFMLKMLTSDLARMLGENTYNLNDAVESELLCDLFYKFCNSLAAETKIVLIIDAVNQLVRTDLMQKFKWLNLYRLSNNVKIIFSCTTDYYQLRYLSALCDNTYKLDYFSRDDIKTISRQFFAMRHKEINDEILKAITRKGMMKNPCRQPIYLLMLLQELNNIGAEDFREIARRKARGEKGDAAIVGYLRDLVHRSPLRLGKKLDRLLVATRAKIGGNVCDVFVSSIAFSSRGLTEKVMEKICTGLNLKYDVATFSYFRKLFRSNLLQREDGAWDFNHSLVKEHFFNKFRNTSIGNVVIDVVWRVITELDAESATKEREFIRFAALSGHTDELGTFLRGKNGSMHPVVLSEFQDRRISLNSWRGFFSARGQTGEASREFLLYAMNLYALEQSVCERLVCFALNSLYEEYDDALQCTDKVCSLYIALGKRAYAGGYYSYALDCYRMVEAICKKNPNQRALSLADVYELMASCHYAKGSIFERGYCIRKACDVLSAEIFDGNDRATTKLADIYFSEICRSIDSAFSNKTKITKKLTALADIEKQDCVSDDVRRHVFKLLLQLYADLGSKFEISPKIIQQIVEMFGDEVDERKVEIAFRLSDYYSLRDRAVSNEYLEIAEKLAISQLAKSESLEMLKLYDEILDAQECRPQLHSDTTKRLLQERVNNLKKIVAHTQDYVYVERYISEAKILKRMYGIQPDSVGEMKKLRTRLVKSGSTELQKLTEKMFRLTWLIILSFYFVLPQIPFAYMGTTVVQLFGSNTIQPSIYLIYCNYLSAVMQGTINTALCLSLYGIMCLLMRGVGFSTKYTWWRRTCLHIGLFIVAFVTYYLMWQRFVAELTFHNSFFPRQAAYTLMIGAGFLLLMEICVEFAYSLGRERKKYPYRRLYRESVMGLPARLCDYSIRLGVLAFTVAIYYCAKLCGVKGTEFMVLPQREFWVIVALIAVVIALKVFRDIIAAIRWRKYGKSV